MKLFTVGPVEMYPETLETAAKQLPYFRTREFSNLMYENEEMFRESINAPSDAKTVFLTASGTAAMEAVVMNCFTEADRLLVINGGSFGKRFEEICTIHQIPFDDLRLKFDEQLTEEKLKPFEENGYSGLLVNLNETSIGKLYDIHMLSQFCRRKGIYLIVDAIGAYGADRINFEEDEIDALIVSSQKALALSPGIAIIEISRRLYEDRVLRGEAGCLYFDFKLYVENQKRGQTPFTPAVGILLELHERLKQIRRIGMMQMQKDIQELAFCFRKHLLEKGFVIPQYPLSNALTPVILTPNARKMHDRLKEEYGLIVTPNGGEMEEKLIRVGHLGCLNGEDHEKLLSAMEKIRETL